ncbi:protein-L-isoaspartate O-methyltransferase [Rhodobacterales bacterium HKCCE2091]|nr:protein-L-isoaspartate O-methyltransferase [Rhodobacterales bacterium HKCCE2091]
MADFSRRRVMMVDTQVRPSDVTKFPIIDAMLNIPRESFVPPSSRDVAYAGTPIPIGNGRVVTEPRTLAKLLSALDIGPDDSVLVIGAGLGYASAVIARMASAVVALEEDPDLAREAESALATEGLDNAVVVEGALAEGRPKEAPYDVILVDGGVEKMPEAIESQLREGGRIGAVFMSGQLGEARVGVRAGGRVSWRMEFNATAPVLPGFAVEQSFVF